MFLTTYGAIFMGTVAFERSYHKDYIGPPSFTLLSVPIPVGMMVKCNYRVLHCISGGSTIETHFIKKVLKTVEYAFYFLSNYII
jgi:hypothetical protein